MVHQSHSEVLTLPQHEKGVKNTYIHTYYTPYQNSKM